MKKISLYILTAILVSCFQTGTADAVNPQVAASYRITLGLKADGTVVAVGNNDHGQCNLSSWTSIVQVAASLYHTVGLKADGSVVATGGGDVSSWTGIIQVAAGDSHTVGLKADGTVVAVGNNSSGQCNVAGWTGIMQVAAGSGHTIGLKVDGSVVATGEGDVSSWTSIVQVAAGIFIVGLKSDGSVVATGEGDVSSWTSIVQVAAGLGHIVGLKSDGTVVAVGDNYFVQCNVDSWTNIIKVAAGFAHTVGIKTDGRVVAIGYNEYGQCNLYDWDLLPNSPTLIKLVSFTATPKSGKVIIQWSTESEIDNAGFNIYRATAEDGQYTKINFSLIPAEGSTTQGASYEFTDSGLKNRKTYFYKLEDIDTNGISTFHVPLKLFRDGGMGWGDPRFPEIQKISQKLETLLFKEV